MSTKAKVHHWRTTGAECFAALTSPQAARVGAAPVGRPGAQPGNQNRRQYAKTRALTVLLPDSTVRRLTSLAHARGTSRNFLIALALAKL